MTVQPPDYDALVAQRTAEERRSFDRCGSLTPKTLPGADALVKAATPFVDWMATVAR